MPPERRRPRSPTARTAACAEPDGSCFKVMRRANASLGHSARVDPKVAADQRGHGIGVSLDEYTMSNLKDKGVAAKKLENSVLGRKVVRMPNRRAS